MVDNILKLDVRKEQSYKYLKCKQYDNAYREYKLIITDNNIPITLTGKEILAVYMEKPNGESKTGVCDYRDGFYYLKFYDWMLDVSGDATVEIKIYSSDKQETYGTMNFHVNIQKSLLNHDAFIKTDEFDLINYLMYQISGVPALIEQMNSDIKKIEQNLKEIQANIDDYQKQYGELSSDAKKLIKELTDIKTDLLALENSVSTNEEERISKETERVQNENKRTTAENERVIHENQRVSDEQIRQQGYNDVLETTDNAKHYISEMDLAIQKSKQVTNDTLAAANEITSKIPILDESLEKSEKVLADIDVFNAVVEDVTQMSTEVAKNKEHVEQAKQHVDNTIKNSLLESSGDILEQIKSYFERAESIYQSMTFDADGETARERAFTLVSVDGGTLDERMRGGGGMDFDGGTASIRLLGG